MDRIFPGCITPAQTISAHENDSTQHTAIINPWFAMHLRDKKTADNPSARPSANTGHLSSVSSRSLNHILPPISMRPEPRECSTEVLRMERLIYDDRIKSVRQADLYEQGVPRF